MATKIYVGNMGFSVTTEELQGIFAEFGEIEDAIVITDRATGRSKGFGFVTFSQDSDAQTAIETVNGREIGGRPATVNVARPREDRGGGGGRGGSRGGGGGGRGGYGGGGGGGRY